MDIGSSSVMFARLFFLRISAYCEIENRSNGLPYYTRGIKKLARKGIARAVVSPFISSKVKHWIILSELSAMHYGYSRYMKIKLCTPNP